MEVSSRRKLEMATRVLEFARAHPSTETGYATVLARLEERLAHATALVNEERNGRIAAQAANRLRVELREHIHTKYLPNLVRVGEQVAKQRPSYLGKFRLRSSGATHSAFLISTRAMMALAAEEKELFENNGLAGALLEELGKQVAQLEEATQASIGGRRGHIGARAELKVVAGEIVEIVKVLDGYNRFRFRTEPKLQGAWDGARNILGRSRRQVTQSPVEKPVEGRDAPPEVGGVAPAA
jgi:hypothetical protein